MLAPGVEPGENSARDPPLRGDQARGSRRARRSAGAKPRCLAAARLPARRRARSAGDAVLQQRAQGRNPQAARGRRDHSGARPGHRRPLCDREVLAQCSRPGKGRSKDGAAPWRPPSTRSSTQRGRTGRHSAVGRPTRGRRKAASNPTSDTQRHEASRAKRVSGSGQGSNPCPAASVKALRARDFAIWGSAHGRAVCKRIANARRSAEPFLAPSAPWKQNDAAVAAVVHVGPVRPWRDSGIWF
jgi:hypothetical protein